MATAWRIVKARHAATAFSGKGALDFGGRWNSRGVSVVYTSSTQALAVLECVVHLNPRVSFEYVMFRIEIEDRFVEFVPSKSLPDDWQLEPPSRSTQRLGDGWVREGRSAALAVPSAIIPDELNYLLNPSHPDFKAVLIGSAQRFALDRRLLA